MKKFTLRLAAVEPLIITNGSAEGMAHSCLDYIPGSMLLGAFATEWLRRHRGSDPDATPEFQCLFLDGSISWGCAYPLCAGRPCVPVPLCYMREKSMGALPLPDADAGKDYAVFNVLPLAADETLSEWWTEHGQPGEKDKGAPPKFKKLQAAFMQPEIMRQPRIRKVWNTRVALGKTRHALEGQLFGFTAIGAGCEFSTEIYCRTEAAEQALAALLQGLATIRVGHARSAGYGLVRLTAEPASQVEPAQIEASVLNLYLLSDFLPAPAWENPLTSLQNAVEELVGCKLRPGKLNLAYRRIEGFNSHWHKWRDTRTGLAAGSVVQFLADGSVKPGSELMLGAEQQEGYGRILLNPAFLDSVAPEIGAAIAPAAPKSAPKPAGLAFRILGERALERLARRQAEAWLQDKGWQDFLKDASSNEHPTASQRARLIGITDEVFQSMLEKSAAAQWQTTACSDPFGDRREYLDKIIMKLLNLGKFLEKFPLDSKFKQVQLNAGDGKLAERAHEIFKRELVRAWGRESRILKNKEGAR